MNPTPTQIANKIELFTGIKIFENTRRKPVIELRSLLVYLLREKLGMRWLSIALFFKSRGKPIHHATLIYSNKQYRMYKKTNSHLKEIEKLFSFKFNLTYDEIDKIHYLESQVKNLKVKLENCYDTPNKD
tara:strand:+ start:654 stop:1043 length:390 start_codon:yes stop_codon:yes gene_type:complete